MKKSIAALIFLMFVVSSGLLAQGMKTYYPNGKVQMEMSDEGMKTYYESGQIMSQIDYKDGEPAGIGKSYYEDGKLMREDDFEKGQWRQYGPDGNLVAEGSVE